jgi:hypothetical protein
MDCFASLAMTAAAGDCFAEPVIGPAERPDPLARNDGWAAHRATRWLAMTAWAPEPAPNSFPAPDLSAMAAFPIRSKTLYGAARVR